MMVRYWMTESPVTITDRASLDNLLELFQKRKIRRVPVLKDNKLCGIVSLSDLYRLISPKKTRMAILPEKYKEKLNQHQVSQIMSKDPVSCSPNDYIEDIADIMRRKKIGVLPVVKNEEVVGIITESDIFDAIIKISTGGKGSKRITFKIPTKERTHEFYEIIKLCEEKSVNILTLLSHACGDEGLVLVTLRISGRNSSALVKALWKSHHQVLDVN